ncbi:multicopper oxidase domain-containing protein [Nocardia sp. NPDC052254]|uniref:multicopper oxidase family protein n=1 Tax=Nocardia sp. NPDC052254 TaxID=3155681 RepID=UPI003426724D
MASIPRSALRRTALWLSIFLVAGLLAAVGLTGWAFARAKVSTAGAPFTDELAIPPLATGRLDPDGTRVFDLDMRSGTRRFLPGQDTPTWGFNGDHLGPTLRAHRGERVRVDIGNRLPEASTVHWHGMHLPASADGGPHQMIAPGATWSPEWTVDQPAATLWYHPHPHGATESHVRRGLAGMFLVDDDIATGLPGSYGVDDLPLIVQDVKFRGGSFDNGRGAFADTGILGDRTMVNGTLAPYRTVDDELVRLRLLNAASARIFTFGFAGDRTFDLIGTDGGLLERPIPADRIRLSPGERAEIVVRMRPAERLTLRALPTDLGDGFWNRRFSGGDDTFDVLELRAAETLRATTVVPPRLAPPELPRAEDSVRERTMELRFPNINGAPMSMDRVDATVERGTTETWIVRNSDGMAHNFHVHDVQFAVAAVDDRPPPPALRGRKDTVLLPPGGSMRLVLRFDGPADPRHPYMYHCHLLWHEDQGMMGQFTVVEPGTRVPSAPMPSGHEH